MIAVIIAASLVGVIGFIYFFGDYFEDKFYSLRNRFQGK